MYDSRIIEEIREILSGKMKTVAVAESVTSGHLQAALSSATLASEFFQGGITVYNLGQKCRQLDVEPIHAESVNCISEQVAEQMARAVCSKFCSDYGIGITGYASKVPEKGVNELFAWFAIAVKNEVLLVKKITSATDDITKVQADYTNQVLLAFLNILKKG